MNGTVNCVHVNIMVRIRGLRLLQRPALPARSKVPSALTAKHHAREEELVPVAEITHLLARFNSKPSVFQMCCHSCSVQWTRLCSRMHGNAK